MFEQATRNYKLLILLMKKSITLLFVLCAFLGKAQIWFDLGAKLGYGPSMSFNKNSFNNLDYSYKYAGAFLYGGKLSVNFNPNHAIVGELLFNQFTHAVNVKGNPNKVNLKYMQIPVMYRNNSDNGGYTEIGVQFTCELLNDVESVEARFKFLEDISLLIGEIPRVKFLIFNYDCVWYSKFEELWRVPKIKVKPFEFCFKFRDASGHFDLNFKSLN